MQRWFNQRHFKLSTAPFFVEDVWTWEIRSVGVRLHNAGPDETLRSGRLRRDSLIYDLGLLHILPSRITR